MSILSKTLLKVLDSKRLGSNIKVIFLKIISNIYVFFVVTFLTFKVVSKYARLGVPWRQILMLDTALKVTRALEENDIDYCLIGGSLLGAIRQGAFAGRPGDFDICIKDLDSKKIISLNAFFSSVGLTMVDWDVLETSPSRYGSITILPTKLAKARPLRSQVHVMKYEFLNGAWRWKRWERDGVTNHPMRLVGVKFPETESKCYSTIFGYEFPVLVNSEDYLVASYGQDWRTPDSKQFSWRNTEITRN